MVAVVAFVLGLAIGAGALFFILFDARKRLVVEREEAQQAVKEARDAKADADEKAKRLAADGERLRSQVVSFDELLSENMLLKRDLRNAAVRMRKLELDQAAQHAHTEQIDLRCVEVGRRYLQDNLQWLTKSMTPNNFVNQKQKLTKVIERCRGIGMEIPPVEEEQYYAQLKNEFQRVVRVAVEREEQTRIKAQIREEERLQREIDRELQQLERERIAINAALEQALRDTHDAHSEEVQRLQERLAEAEARSQRAISQAQLTKSGYVYVISNIGSFGDRVYKIGMTRRLDPADRIRELGDASVPFPFDVHMMISSDDAPKLENALHRAFYRNRINKVNLRKEFFRVDLDEIRRIVAQNHGEVEYVADAEALEYRQSLEATDEDAEFIESSYEDALDECDAPAVHDD